MYFSSEPTTEPAQEDGCYHQLIQYDMSVGKNYLKDTGFVDLPE